MPRRAVGAGAIFIPAFALAAIALLTALAVLLATPPTARAQAPKGPVSFINDVAPILKENCFACHDAKKRKGKFDMTTFEYVIDDDNWFCWHGTRRSAEGMVFERIPIPDRPGWLKRPERLSGLGPVAAIMQGRPDQLQLH